MGNSSSKDGRSPGGHDGRRGSPTHYDQERQYALSHNQQLANQIYGASSRSAGTRRTSQSNLAFLNIGGRDHDQHGSQSDRPRETKPERDARRAERDRQTRLKERERSMREEIVDGGFLVTLGTYTGVEDFNKSVVRQLQIERRLAPFWKGLDDHSSAWTEAQLVAAAQGRPVPAPDEVPPEALDMERTASHGSTPSNLMVPITGRSLSHQSDNSANLSASHPAFSTSGPSSPSILNGTNLSSTQLFRGRAKTLASLASGGRHHSSSDLTPQEIRLPADPYVNGTRLEAVLYKDASECPICFLYYPPYLNRTRCCAQDICSECFVQIKRPDPHPPEHEQPGATPAASQEDGSSDSASGLLVSEVAACPFCVAPDFGVTYDPPSFRRGLAYGSSAAGGLHSSALSSTTSLSPSAASGGAPPLNRRRTTSLSATAPNVITTDRVRPDWAKKLADARAHALRRAAAATALHNAAYMLGSADATGQQSRSGGGLRGLRSRRTVFIENGPAGSSAGDGESGADAGSGGLGRITVRTRNGPPRVEDLEELMMMEAIRLSLAAEEERKRKEEKEAAKEAKKKAKEEKKAEKRGGSGGGSGFPGFLSPGASASAVSLGSGSPSPSAQRQRNLSAGSSASPSMHTSIASPSQGKGKQPVTTNADTTPSPGDKPSPDLEHPAQKHLEASRAQLHPQPVSPNHPAQHRRQLSHTSSLASSFAESTTGSLRGAAAGDASSGATAAQSSLNEGESMFNFRSLAAMVDVDERALDGVPQQADDGPAGHEERREKEGADRVEHLEFVDAAEHQEEEGQAEQHNANPAEHGKSATATMTTVTGSATLT